ncbi:NAD-dependent epimerase/dehydratase family protein [Halovenus sp. WSH3]|uniref:NAD-dependent epimerase/dehydratase family protein n=1 Tax=Halovenus carboxidivorans TaxID=2692199 RepID=A0A6B0T0X7_9EURY|nr:NAD-dependent epimerase/dehydratase family protein [Halovenus carboxidivorans]MXR51714.1 NAD-dependent epimerase/dehydratase family protein [Halovenus carboxidivorans]
MSDRTVLVTGGCGYIGSALVPELQRAEETDNVVVFDSLAGGSPANLMDADVGNGFEFRQGDVRNYGEVESAMRGVDAVIHLAAVTGAASTHDRREETFAVNLDGTRNVLNAAEKLGVETVTFASSCNNYGRAPHENVDETTDPRPINPYAESKLAAEELLAEFDGDATALRLSTNYGHAPGIRFNLVVNTFVFRALTGRPLTVYGDGSNWRPFIHVSDAARAFARATLEPDSWPELVYNVGANSENYRISDIAEIVHDEVGTGVDITYLEDEHPGPSYHVNFDRVEETGYEPEYTLREGVRELATAFTNDAFTAHT